MKRKNTLAVPGEASVLPSVLPPPALPPAYWLFVTFLPKKTASVTGKKTHRVFVIKINHHNRQPSGPRLQWTSPQKTASVRWFRLTGGTPGKHVNVNWETSTYMLAMTEIPGGGDWEERLPWSEPEWCSIMRLLSYSRSVYNEHHVRTQGCS